MKKDPFLNNDDNLLNKDDICAGYALQSLAEEFFLDINASQNL